MVLDVNLRTQKLNFEGLSFFICNSRALATRVFDFYIWNQILFLLFFKKKCLFVAAKRCFVVCLLKWQMGYFLLVH